MKSIFYPKNVKSLIKRYKNFHPKCKVKYIPEYFASIEIYDKNYIQISALELYEFRQKIEELENNETLS
jgi:hypothetical protein